MVVVLGALVVAVIVLAARSRKGGGSGARGPALVLLLVFGGFFLVVGGGGFLGGGGDVPEDPPGVTIVEPLDSTAVSSPVTVAVTAERLGGHHLHLAVDAACTPGGEVVPTDASHRHLASGETRVTLDLPAGEHTLCLQAGDAAHRARPEAHEITFLVEPA